MLGPTSIRPGVLRAERDNEVVPMDPDQLKGWLHIRPRTKDDWVEVGFSQNSCC